MEPNGHIAKDRSDRFSPPCHVFIAVLLCIVYPSGICFGSDAAAAFLEMSPDAGGAGMGNARVSLTSGGATGFWNPAGLVHLNAREGIAAYRALSLGRSLGLLGYGQRVDPGAGFGLLWISAGVDDLVGRDMNGRRTGELSNRENAFCFSFARSVTRKVSLGLTMRYLYHTLAEGTARGPGFDLGVLFRPNAQLSFGAVVRNVSARLSWRVPVEDRETTAEERPPTTFVGGISGRTFSDRLTIAMDVQLCSDLRADLRAGCSVALNPAAEFTAGLVRPSGHEGLPSAAFGLGLCPFPERNLWFRYAYVTDALEAGASHAFSTEFAF